MLDVALEPGSTKHFADTPAGFVTRFKWLKQGGVKKICCEATGGFEQRLTRAAWDQAFDMFQTNSLWSGTLINA